MVALEESKLVLTKLITSLLVLDELRETSVSVLVVLANILLANKSVKILVNALSVVVKKLVDVAFSFTKLFTNTLFRLASLEDRLVAEAFVMLALVLALRVFKFVLVKLVTVALEESKLLFVMSFKVEFPVMVKSVPVVVAKLVVPVAVRLLMFMLLPVAFSKDKLLVTVLEATILLANKSVKILVTAFRIFENKLLDVAFVLVSEVIKTLEAVALIKLDDVENKVLLVAFVILLLDEIRLVTVALEETKFTVFVVVAVRLFIIAVPVAVKLVPVAFVNLRLLE
jgi:hypothetical protein